MVDIVVPPSHSEQHLAKHTEDRRCVVLCDAKGINPEEALNNNHTNIAADKTTLALLPTLSAGKATVARSPVPDGESDGCGTSDFVRLNVPKLMDILSYHLCSASCHTYGNSTLCCCCFTLFLNLFFLWEGEGGVKTASTRRRRNNTKAYRLLLIMKITTIMIAPPDSN